MALHRYLVEEVALDCAEGMLTRREALRRLALLGVSLPAATALLAACGDDADSGATTIPGTSQPPTPSTTTGATTGATTTGATQPTSQATTSAAPETTSETTSPTRVSSVGEEIRFPGPRGELIGVLSLAATSAGTTSGAVLVIHENRGLTPHIRSIPPRLAADGYTALAIDLLSEEGGTASLPSEGDATAALGSASDERLIADLRAGLDELERRAPGAKLAVIGFCFGGGMTWRLLAAGEPRLAAAVPFYGPAPTGADFSGSPNAAVLGIYAENDDRVNGTMDAASAGLTAAGLTHELRVFPGVGHAFFNDTGSRYDAEQAAAAYAALLAWFETHLAAP